MSNVAVKGDRTRKDRSSFKEDGWRDAFNGLSNYFQETLVMMKHYFNFEFPPFDDLNSTGWEAFKKQLKASIKEEKLSKMDLEDSIKNYKDMLNSKCLELEQMQEKLANVVASKGFFDKEANLSAIMAGDLMDKKGIEGLASLLNDVLLY